MVQLAGWNMLVRVANSMWPSRDKQHAKAPSVWEEGMGGQLCHMCKQERKHNLRKEEGEEDRRTGAQFVASVHCPVPSMLTAPSRALHHAIRRVCT